MIFNSLKNRLRFRHVHKALMDHENISIPLLHFIESLLQKCHYRRASRTIIARKRLVLGFAQQTSQYHPRKWVVRSDPFYNTAVGGSFRFFDNTTHGSGWFVQILSKEARYPPL